MAGVGAVRDGRRAQGSWGVRGPSAAIQTTLVAGVGAVRDSRRAQGSWGVRGLSACRQEGILPPDSVYRPMESFRRRGEGKDLRRLRYEHYCEFLKGALVRVDRRLEENNAAQGREVLPEATASVFPRLDTSDVDGTLKSFGVDPSSLPQWLDLNGDGRIDADELAPLISSLEAMKKDRRTYEAKLNAVIRRNAQFVAKKEALLKKEEEYRRQRACAAKAAAVCRKGPDGQAHLQACGCGGGGGQGCKTARAGDKGAARAEGR